MPVKRFSCANERLAGVLSPPQREELARVMLGDVLSNVAEAQRADAVFLVTAEAGAMSMGRRLGMEIIAEREQSGESSSVDFAMKKCAELGVRTVLVVPGDIPLATAREFDAVMEKDDGGGGVVIVPSKDGTGTNGLMMSPCGAIRTSFGEGSFLRHKQAAEAAGISFSSLTLAGIGLDIDGPDDLEMLMNGAGVTNAGVTDATVTSATVSYLRGIGLTAAKGSA